jgi:hypothetical protein
MDSATLCALMLKAKRVFGSDQTFLSFPLSPVPFTRRELDFFDQSSADAERASNRAQIEFSRQVNLIPTGEAWHPAGSGFLWDAYIAVLTESDVAQTVRTPEEDSAYQAALTLLREGDGDDTAIVKKYKQHRDAFIVCREKYLAAKLTAEYGTESERELWRSTEEPALKSQMDALTVNWVLHANKTKVEDAQNLIAILGARSPSKTMAEWRSRCNPDIDQLNDPADHTSVFPTSFSPANAVDQHAWCRFTLSPAEITSLLLDAPAEWRRTMLGDAPVSTTQSIAFEFSSAAIVRPWFDPVAFKSRFWRFSDPSRLLSDGKSPPTGECTAHASGIVFARHVQIVDTAPTVGVPPAQPFVGLEFKMVTRAPRAISLATRFSTPPSHDGGVLLRQIGTPHVAKPGSELPTAVPNRVDHRAMSRAAADSASTLPAANISKFDRLRGTSVLRPDIADVHLAASSLIVSAPSTPALATSSPLDETIFVLAFICKKLGRSPDPDESLSW